MKKLFSFKRSGVRSGLEETFKKDLIQRGIKYEYESVKLRYVKSSCKSCGEVVTTGTYTPDFIFKHRTGNRLIIETKGRFTGSDREKHKSVKRDNPDEDIRFVFERDSPIRKGSKTRNSDWCLKNGFKCHIGRTMPDLWVKEVA